MAEQDYPYEMAGKLAAKVARCYAEIANIPKSGKNKEQNYAFVTNDDVLLACRAAMSKHGLALMIVSMMEPEEREVKTKSGTIGRHVVLPITYALTDCETGYAQLMVWRGECSEFGDKALTKCVTASGKSLLRAMFLIPSEDEPDVASPPGPAARPASELMPKAGPKPDEEVAGDYLKSIGLTKEQFAVLKTPRNDGRRWQDIALAAKGKKIADLDEFLLFAGLMVPTPADSVEAMTEYDPMSEPVNAELVEETL